MTGRLTFFEDVCMQGSGRRAVRERPLMLGESQVRTFAISVCTRRQRDDEKLLAYGLQKLIIYQFVYIVMQRQFQAV